MPSNLPRVTVRMEQETIDKLNKIAEQENRSTNQQIVHVLKKFIEQYEQEQGRINSAELSVTKIG